MGDRRLIRTGKRSRLVQEFRAIAIMQWVSGNRGLVGQGSGCRSHCQITIGDWVEPGEGSFDASLVGLSLSRSS